MSEIKEKQWRRWVSRAFIVAGMAFGDEGKGTTVEYLCHRHNPTVVIRYNGGPQAAHNVIAPDGTHHSFSQFGSGTLAGVRTHLSRFMLIEPRALLREAEVLRSKGVDGLLMLSIDPECVIITPFHWLANEIREIYRGAKPHGSTGRGVGEARQDQLGGLALRVKDLYKRSDTLNKIYAIRDAKADQIGAIITAMGDELPRPNFVDVWHLYDRLCSINVDSLVNQYQDFLKLVDVIRTYNLVDGGDVIVFEGAQGVLLDEYVGFAPHNTWTNTTFKNAEVLCRECQISEVTKIGVVRSYFTRHGAGPFPTEAQARVSDHEMHNGPVKYVGPFRVGRFDNVLFRYAARHSRPDVVMVTHMDRTMFADVADSYTVASDDILSDSLVGTEEMTTGLLRAIPVYTVVQSVPRLIEATTGIPVIYESYGPSASDKWEKYISAGPSKKDLTPNEYCVTVPTSVRICTPTGI
jgi:adenylosuccinate synthase